MALLDRAFGALTQLGYSPAQATGILGNLKIESGLNPNAVGDNGTSYGLAQWHNERASGLKNYAAARGLLQSDPVAQIQYLDWELKNKEPRAYKALQAAQTPQDAAAAFLHFERPQGYSADNPLGSLGAQKRVAAATELFNTLGGKSEPTAQISGSSPVLASGLAQPALATPAAVADAGETELPAETPQYDRKAMQGLLTQLMAQEPQSPQFPQLPQELPEAPVSRPRARGLAFQQLTVKTPRFSRG